MEGGIIVSERPKEGPFGEESLVREGIFSAESASAKMIQEISVCRSQGVTREVTKKITKLEALRHNFQICLILTMSEFGRI